MKLWLVSVLVIFFITDGDGNPISPENAIPVEKSSDRPFAGVRSIFKHPSVGSHNRRFDTSRGLLMPYFPKSLLKSGCYWDGSAPFCAGSCPRGWTSGKRSSSGDGLQCWTGDKVYCCKKA